MAPASPESFATTYHNLVSLLAGKAVPLADLGNAYHRTFDKKTSFWKQLGWKAGLNQSGFMKLFPATFTITDGVAHCPNNAESTHEAAILETIYARFCNRSNDGVAAARSKLPAQYQSLPVFELPADYSIMYKTTWDGCQLYCQALLNSGPQHIGIDFEFEPISQRVELIQIATDTGCLLAHVGKFGCKTLSEMPPSLLALLSSHDVIKCGVDFRNDFQVLALAGFYVPPNQEGWKDLSLVVLSKGHKRFFPTASGPVGLGELVAVYLHHIVPKPFHLQTGDWGSNKALTVDQQRYAAMDAYAALAIDRAVGI